MKKNKKIKPIIIPRNHYKKINIVRIFAIYLVFFSFFGIGLLMNLVHFAFDTDLNFTNLQFEQPSQSVVIYDNNGNIIVNNHLKTVAEINEIPTYTKNAFIAIEDKRFYEHNGVDVYRILGATVNNIQKGKYSQGASTITQQLIKNTMLSNEKTIERKLKEMGLAIQLETKWNKEKILEAYLNKIYFGNNQYGIARASKFYFDKEVSNLSLKESAILAGLINAPSAYDPIKYLDKALNRSNVVLKEMLKQNKITEEEFNTAKEEEIKIAQNNELELPLNSYERESIAEACQILDCTLEDLYKKNYKIVTYQDKKLQNILKDIQSNENFYIKNPKGIAPDSLQIIGDNKTKGVVAYVGKSDENLSNLKRQPGSIIKPIICFAPAIEEGLINKDSMLFDEKITINNYSPSNFNNTYYGWVTASSALEKSLNTVAVKLMDYVGIENCKEFAKKLGIKFNENDQGLSLALGGFTDGVSLIDLASAYSSFATEGKFEQLNFVKEIYDNNNKLIYSRETFLTKSMSVNTANEITEMLKNTTKNGTAKRLDGYNLASKTGTVASTSDKTKNTDVYNLSYNENYTFAIWQGNTNGENGLLKQEVNGGTYPTIIMQNIIKNL